MYPPYQLFNAWTNLYVYHDTWTHLNGVFNKFLPSICESTLLGDGSVQMLPRKQIHMQL
jgi:hypothetical protein